ncbi:penicillin acylase family protein [Amycolatopsis pittospori]|uniref:penicillin acylase family protein n=1 Tax=Amycolatopsis pittospori TaxID=2749434 RepID=UPI001F267557|nr:penicillin acylase family protein [Amycolatopsis pittospori]
MRWRLGLLGIVFLVGAAGMPPVTADATTRWPSVTQQVRGLTQPVDLLVDKWGVPHIYAQNTADVFLAQGFGAARDRIFQMDLWRRKGLGLLSEVFGDSFAEQDRAARLFLYRGGMTQEWAKYGPEGKLAATRFADGVNAYVDFLAANPAALPEEFRKLGYSPARWSAEDVVRIRAHGLSQNLKSEVARAKIACAGGIEADRYRVRLEPAHSPPVPAGFDPCALPADVARVFTLATGGLDFSAGASVPDPLVEVPEGSNAWVVGTNRSSTGRPVLASDPHRAMPAPATRYVSHLNAPGLDVIGAGEPFAPGISLGHNEVSGFSLTISAMDQEDLYVYELDPADPSRYRYGGGWERFTTVTERIPLRGGGTKEVALQFTRHGPVIKTDTAGNRAYAVRAAWLEPGMSPYYGSLKHLRAKNFGEFKQSVDSWGAPGLNHVYANTSGEIGMAVGGLAPRRTGYDGLLPVPGDGRYDWNGFVPAAELPRVHNPANGLVVTANEYNGTAPGVGYEWSNPARFQRINEVLGSKPRSSPSDSATLQNDQLSLQARRLVTLLQGLNSTDPAVAEALSLLKSWNGVLDAGSAPALLFEVWFMWHLGPNFLYSVLPPAVAGAIFLPDQAVLMDAMDNPDRYFGPGGAAVRDQLLLKTLGTAMADAKRRGGADSAKWKWGELHRVTFAHPLAPKVDEATAARWNAGPASIGGSWNTVNSSVYSPVDYQGLAGPSFRMVLDVGNWDAAQMINAPGQSGDPNSPGYEAMTEKWRTGKYVPLVYSRDAVERNTVLNIRLVPKP